MKSLLILGFSLSSIYGASNPIVCDQTKACSDFMAKVSQSFKLGTPLKKDMKTSGFHGKCHTSSTTQSGIKETMGLILIDNIGTGLHFNANQVSFLPEMEQGWNPYQYTTIESLREASGGFHLEKEQELFIKDNYSYNKRRVEQVDSFHHIYINQDHKTDKINIVGTKAGVPYFCQMKPNLTRPAIPEEQGIPISFGEDYCEISYRCDDKAKSLIQEYHEMNSLTLKGLIGRPLKGSCKLNSGRGTNSFSQTVHTLFSINEGLAGLTLSQKITQGGSQDPFVSLTDAEALSLLSKKGVSHRNLINLDSFSLAISPYSTTWLRSNDLKLIVLGRWMGKAYACEASLCLRGKPLGNRKCE